ncbi:unnamed protein product [Tuber aestivum]|uniref:Transcriptional regulatory protein DEP1 n=1 Tax=Tuber aestivum TaxID=59557 RepID=A0A292PPV2_9PEZI|nr:unnamed protein product [Tuber aestivum]
MTPALKRGSRNRPSSTVLEESAGRRSGKRTRSASSLPLSSEPAASIYPSINGRSRSASRPTARERLHRDVEGPTDELREPALADRMAPDSTTTTVEIETVTIGALEALNGSTRSTLTGGRRKHTSHASDRDSVSSLSDIGEDSEAETERLHNSPQKQGPRLVQHKSTSSTVVPFSVETLGRKEMGDRDEDRATGLGESTPATPTTSSSPSRKRKRETNGSPAPRPVEEPKSRQSTPPLKKRSQIAQEVSENESTSANSRRGSNTEATTDTVSNGIAQDSIMTNSKDVRPPKPVKAIPPKNEVVPGNTGDEQDPEPVVEAEAEADEAADATTSAALEEEPCDNVDTTREDDEDTERVRRKNAAMEDLAEIERVFAQLKDRIYSEKLKRVDMEMKMVQDGTHPEFVAQKTCIDQKLEEKVRLADAHYKYGMESLSIATRVSRAQVHSQYFQTVRHLREDALEKCSELWYQIQRERRAGDALVSEFSYRIPDRQSTRIKQRQQYNWEVALLSGIAKHIGFPAAPDVVGASEEEIVDDLECMGIATRVPARAGVTVPPTGSLRERVPVPDDSYGGLLPTNWSHPQPSPPSPAPQPAHQAPGHPHVHIHHHHHHNRRHTGPNQPDQAPYLARRGPSAQGHNPGHQPSAVSLSSLLQNDVIKMEGPSTHPPSTSSMGATPHPPPRASQLYSSQSAQHSLPPPTSLQQHMNPFARPSNADSHQGHPSAPQRLDIGRGSTPGDARTYSAMGGRGSEVLDGGLRKLKEENDSAIGIGPPVLGAPAPLRYGPRMSYS